MDTLQLDAGNAILLVVCCGLLCGVGVVVFLALQVVTGLLDVVLSVFEMFFGILSGDPLSCCGCIFVVAACGACTLLTLFFTQSAGACGTPQASILCELLGR